MASNRSRVTEHLMRICAARLDPAVTADEFVELLNILVEWCVEAGRNEQTDEPTPAGDRELTGPNHFGVRWRSLGRDGPCEDCDGEVCTMNCGPSASDGRQDTPAHLHRPRKGRGGGGGRKISEETREEIRLEAEQARDDDGNLPRGFVAGLAEEHGVSPQTIYNILAD